jgi:hypothetical protein
MFNNISNQLLQIDTGVAATYLYNPTLGLAPYAGIGENQILGQRYFGTIAQSGTTPGSALTAATYPTNYNAANAAGSPVIYMLVQYSPASALSTVNLTTAGAPAPVYWTDNTFTTVTGITTEGIGGTTLGLAFPAGYMLLNTATGYGNAGTALTAAALLGGFILIQVAGYLKGAYVSGSTAPGIGAWIVPVAGTLSSNSIAAGSTTTYQPFGRQLTAVASNLCDVLVGCDLV